MKRIISFAAALAVVFGAASCKKDDLASKDGDVQVVFNFEIPQEVATKATMAEGSRLGRDVKTVEIDNSSHIHIMKE